MKISLGHWRLQARMRNTEDRKEIIKIIDMNKISFICMCASEAVHTDPDKHVMILTALKEGFTPQEAKHLYECCSSIHRNSK